MNAHSFDIPILLITFNRPDYTKRIFERIRQLQPKHLFVFSDAARIGNELEKQAVENCRALFTENEIDWDCQVRRFCAPHNLGCGKGVSSAITWAFDHAERLIILEDDCLPDLSFFDYCAYMLNEYENDDRVMHVAGTRWNEEFKRVDNEHFFSAIGHIWGWATWKRAWLNYDYEMRDWTRQSAKKMLRERTHGRLQMQFWSENFCFIQMKKDSSFTWDYQWQYVLFKKNGWSVVPPRNLINNIGLSGVHTNAEHNNHSFNRITSSWKRPSTRNKIVEVDKRYDAYHVNQHFIREIRPLRKIKMFVKSFL